MYKYIRAAPAECGTALPVLSGVLVGLVSLVCLHEVIQLSQEAIALDAVDHAGFLNGLAPGRGAAQAVHADGKEQGSSLGSNIQNIADDGFFFNLDSHKNDLLIYFLGYYNPLLLKKQEGERIFSADYSVFWLESSGKAAAWTGPID